MFTEMGIKIKALIARKLPGDETVTWIEPKVLKKMAAAEAAAAEAAAHGIAVFYGKHIMCVNNVPDEYGICYCAQGAALDEDEMARYLSRSTRACPFFEAGDEYSIVRKQN